MSLLRIIIVPRWGGHGQSDWYPWLTRELASVPGLGRVTALALPSPGTPELGPWVAGVVAALGRDRDELAHTILVGHSVGARAALLGLAALAPGLQVAGFLAVAGWWTVDRPWPTIEPWIAAAIDEPRVRAATQRSTVLLSDDDPFTADHRANAALWRDRLGAGVVVHPGGKHFNAAVEPAVHTAVLGLVNAG